MTDKQLIILGQRIDKVTDKLRGLCARIAESDHPKADAISSRLIDNELPPTGGRAENIIRKELAR